MSSKIDERVYDIYDIYDRQYNICPTTTAIEFKDIGIVFVKKESIEDSLKKRKKENFDPTNGMCVRTTILFFETIIHHFNLELHFGTTITNTNNFICCTSLQVAGLI